MHRIAKTWIHPRSHLSRNSGGYSAQGRERKSKIDWFPIVIFIHHSRNDTIAQVFASSFNMRTRATRSPRYMRLAIAVVAIFIVLLTYSSRFSHNKSIQTIASSSKLRSNRPRIAVLIPFLGEAPPAYFGIFCQSAAYASSVADFYLLHLPNLRLECESPNVYSQSLASSYQDLAEWLLTQLTGKIPSPDVLEFLTAFLRVRPYGLVEFKPALGHLFAPSTHSHWAYADLDMVWGNLGDFVDLTEDWDITTFGYGDQYRLYMRGQLTVHRNNDKVNLLWRSCDYLSKMDERFAKIMDQTEHFQSESAEGCYSAAALSATDFKVRYLPFAWTDTAEGIEDNVIWKKGVYIGRDSRGGVLYRIPESASPEESQSIARLHAGWWRREGKSGTMETMGAMQSIELPSSDEKCMYWVLGKYQKHLCLPPKSVGVNEAVYWVNGNLYKQRIMLPKLGSTPTAPFFHFQEWKRSYTFDQLATFESDASIVLLTPRGVIPVFAQPWNTPLKRSRRIASPLGIKPSTWNALEDRSQLPQHYYCVKWEKSEKETKCQYSVDWQNPNATIVFDAAPEWIHLKVEQDVTLVVTLQIVLNGGSTDSDVIKAKLATLKDNLENWYGQPSVVVVAVAGVTPETAKLVNRELGGSFTERHVSSFVAVLADEDGGTAFSRNALLNMAIDLVPTRWYLTGVDVENGFVLPGDSSYWATRAALAYSKTNGNVLYAPQFVVKKAVSEFKRLMESSGRKSHLLECSVEREVLSPLEDLWLKLSKLSKVSEEDVVGIVERLALKSLRVAFGSDSTPILLIDNTSKDPLVHTNELVRSIEAADCPGMLGFQQLLILGYDLLVLPRVFSSSASELTPVQCLCNEDTTEQISRVTQVATHWLQLSA